MEEAPFGKCSCDHCGIHIEFPLSGEGAEVDCPECGQKTFLVANEDACAVLAEAEGTTTFNAGELVGAFLGAVPPTPVSTLYRVGLLLVTAIMLVLPALYLAMIGAAAGGVWYWATHFLDLVTSTTGGVRFALLRLTAYVAPLFIGLVLVFFMIKPLFAKRAGQAQPLALNPGAEPLLFAFIAKVCETVGAPFPKRIDLDCQLNASASFRRGTFSFLGNGLVLTIGLPLVSGLTVRQFAGVIAHEFGHFTQGFGMRLTYIIRSVNAWFARVVYERDSWDVMLENMAETEDWRAALIVGLARLGVWFSRQLLALLMLLGHGISCFMLREMEYDADSYEIKLVGSDTFEATTRRLHVLNHALQNSYKGIRTSWNLNRRLPDNFPAYLLSHEMQIPSDQRTKLEDTIGLGETRSFDTHPAYADRIRRARLANEPGVFHLDGPATILFSNFAVPARQVTLLHYADDLRIPIAAATFHLVGQTSEVATEPSNSEKAPEPNMTSTIGPKWRLQKPS